MRKNKVVSMGLTVNKAVSKLARMRVMIMFLRDHPRGYSVTEILQSLKLAKVKSRVLYLGQGRSHPRRPKNKKPQRVKMMIPSSRKCQSILLLKLSLLWSNWTST
jgi:uncharacterized Fe-S cluster-containing MiaB family protein